MVSSNRHITDFGRAEFWESLNPGLTVTDFPFMKSLSLLGESCRGINYVQQVKKEGYFKLDSVIPRPEIDSMAKAMARISELGLPPIFTYVYDEFWQIYHRLSPLMLPVFGNNYRMIENQWAWNFPPDSDSSGFPPHRDGGAVDYDWFPEGTTLRDNGLPLLATIWIPLTDVTPLNSCMYLLPIDKDPHVPDNLDKTSIKQENIQDIRALPCKAGSVLCWNTNVLHWGSNGSEHASEPRMSIATYLLSDGLRRTTKSFSLATAQPLPLAYRLRLIGLNMAQYGGHLMNCPPDLTGYCELYANCQPHDINFQV